MSGFRVRGLLDRPSAQSLGMLGLIVERENRGLYVEGMVDTHPRPVEEGEFAELISAGDAQKVDGPHVDDSGREYAALWVGNEFAEKATGLKVPLPPLPITPATIGDDGTYWIGPTRHVWRVIDSWLILAFRRSIIEQNAELATLMAWTLPEREETKAALWYTMKEKRQSNLQWWARLAKDHEKYGVTERSLNDRFDRISSECRERTLHRVFGFCAPAKGGDNEISIKLGGELDVKRLSFGLWLKKEAVKEGRRPTRRVLQKKGQQMMDKRGALEFCLEVLSGLPMNVSIPYATFVIDGIRHAAVLESLKSLVGEDHFTLVFIDRSKEERRQLLIRDEHVPANEVDEVMNDPTEREVPELAKRAARRFDWLQGVEPIAKELISVY